MTTTAGTVVAVGATDDVLRLLQEQPYSQVEMVMSTDGALQCLERSFTERRRADETEGAFMVRVRGLLQPGDRLLTPANGKLDHVRIVRAPIAPSAWAELHQLLRRLLRLLPLLAGMRRDTTG